MNWFSLTVRNLVSLATYLLLIFVFAFFALWVGPRVESNYFPVVYDGRAVDWHVTENLWRAEVLMKKENRDCEPAIEWKTSGYGLVVPKEGRPFETSISYIGDDTPGSSHVTRRGEQSFGIWQFNSSRIKEGDEIYLTIRSQCHILYNTISPIGPLTVDPE